MSQPADAAGMANFIAKLGLADEFTVKELLFELGDKKGPPEPLIRLMERRGMLTPLQGGKLLKGDKDGYFMGGYRMLYRIASGSFGRVYRGDDPRTGQVVAIKVLRRRWTEDPRRVSLFEREGRLGLSLQHPNIVQILAVNKDSGTGAHFIVMEFVEGGNLRDIISIRKKIELRESLRIMEECANGLAHSYTCGLTHRDIKPSNILMGTDGVAKLVDFGLAEISQGGAGLFLTAKPGEKDEGHAADRTVDYAGLEKATGVKAGDIRSDIYFLGHVLYEMITGEPLMPPTKDRHARMNRRRFEDVETTLARRAETDGLPPSVRALIARAVALEPSQRFQKPEQFLEAIQVVRAELGGGTKGAAPANPDPSSQDTDLDEPGEESDEPKRVPGPLAIVVVEPHPKLREPFETRLAKMGLAVTFADDAAAARKLYKAKPYHALLVDAGTAGPANIETFEKVLTTAGSAGQQICGVLIVNEGQGEQGADFADDPRVAVMIRPVTMKQLETKLRELLPELGQPTRKSVDEPAAQG